MMCGVYGLDFLACWLFKWKVFYRGFDENVQYTMTKWQFCCFFCFSTRLKFTQLIQCEELPPKGQGNFLKFSSSKNARLAFDCNSRITTVTNNAKSMKRTALMRLVRRCSILAGLCTLTDLSCILWYIIWQNYFPIVVVNNGYVGPGSPKFEVFCNLLKNIELWAV